jgi:hypothetical protein
VGAGGRRRPRGRHGGGSGRRVRGALDRARAARHPARDRRA